MLWLVFVLTLQAQQTPLTGPAAKYCILQGRGKPVPCYVIDNIPGKSPRITVPTHSMIVERFTFEDAKRRARRTAKAVGKTVVVVAASPLP